MTVGESLNTSIHEMSKRLGALVTPWHQHHGWGLADALVSIDEGGVVYSVRLIGPTTTWIERARFADGTRGAPIFRIETGEHAVLVADSPDELIRVAAEWLATVK